MASADQPILQFPTSSPSLTVRLHDLAFSTICESYRRRLEGAERVIGTLVGTVSPDGTVDILGAFDVPHNESLDQVALDIEYNQNMSINHQRGGYPKEHIVGWYSTGLGVTGASALIHEFYSREVPNPVHLTVDTKFTNGEGSIKAYVSNSVSLGDQQLALQFQEIPLELKFMEAEQVKSEKIPTASEGMDATMERLLTLIDDIYKYVDDVVEGRVAPDTNVGRMLSEAVGSLPKLSGTEFDKLVNDNFQDHLLLVYLSSIIKTQLSLAKKLNTAAQIL